MALYRDDGIVLRNYKLGEADRIIILFTRTRGKVRAVAKGVRRTKSKFGSRLEPGSVIHGQFYEGRNLDIVTQAESAAVMPTLRTDLSRYGRAAVMLEVVDQISEEGQTNTALYKLVTGALAELDRDGNPLVVPAFVVKVLVLEGVQPLLDRCVTCEATDDLIAIDMSHGGVLCREHRSGDPISDDARHALMNVFDGHVRHVLETTSDQLASELESLSSRLIEQHIERRLRSSTVVDQHLIHDAEADDDSPRDG